MDKYVNYHLEIEFKASIAGFRISRGRYNSQKAKEKVK